MLSRVQLSEQNPAPSLGRLWVFYHYLYPDNVVSATIMDQLCQGLAERGWQVTGFPCNRGWHEEGTTYPENDLHQGVRLRRIWRPRFRQSSSFGRLMNAVWMIVAWSLLVFDQETPDAIVVGTDPILSVLIAVFWKMAYPRIRVVHWCFDLYPEAAFADGMLSPHGWVALLLRRAVRRAYGVCDAIADLGLCMQERLALYGSPAQRTTIVPWALEEPSTPLPLAKQERAEIFGSADLALLYSGSFGRAHTCEGFLALAGALRGQDATMTFSVRGNRVEELRSQVDRMEPGGGCAINFVPFAPETKLLDRLAAPDVHLLSLTPEWTGLVVPSKFFGALAVGRPVLFSGDAGSSIARWIGEYELGWVLHAGNEEAVARDLLAYVRDPARVARTQHRCFDTYRQQFSRPVGLQRFAELLESPVRSEEAQ